MSGPWLTPDRETLIEMAIAKAVRLHPEFEADNFADVLGEEVGEVHRARLDRNVDGELEELLDVIAVCCRRIGGLGR